MAHPRHYAEPAFVEKLVSALSYIQPLIGFAFIIIAALMKKEMKPFLKFHIFQSIFIAFTLWIVITGLGFAMNLISYIPLVKNIVGMITFFLHTPIFLGFSVINTIYSLFILYLIAGVIRGAYSYVPWITDIIKANLRGQI